MQVNRTGFHRLLAWRSGDDGLIEIGQGGDVRGWRGCPAPILMERNMADTAVEVKRTTPASAASAPVPAKTPDVWSSLRGEMDRVFDRFAGAFAMPSLRRMFDFEPARRIESTFTLTVPA